MEEYKSNSYKSKEQTEVPEEKKIEDNQTENK